MVVLISVLKSVRTITSRLNRPAVISASQLYKDTLLQSAEMLEGNGGMALFSLAETIEQMTFPCDCRILMQYKNITPQV